MSTAAGYLRGFADVHVGLLLAFAEVSEVEDGQLVFLLVRPGLQLLHTAMHNRRSKQDTCVYLPAGAQTRTWTRSKISACSLSLSWERYFWMAIFARGG